jgi:FMN phosphatase YigB (HAD superfamily)
MALNFTIIIPIALAVITAIILLIVLKLHQNKLQHELEKEREQKEKRWLSLVASLESLPEDKRQEEIDKLARYFIKEKYGVEYSDYTELNEKTKEDNKLLSKFAQAMIKSIYSKDQEKKTAQKESYESFAEIVGSAIRQKERFY